MAKRHGRRGSTLAPLPSLEETGPPLIRKLNHSVMRDSWTDPDDLRPNVRSGRIVGGHRAFCPLRWCVKRHAERSSFTPEHILAADKLRGLWDGARIGFAGLKDWAPVHSILYRPPLGPAKTALRQWKAARAFDKAWRCLDAKARPVIALVVLANRALSVTATTLGITPALAGQRAVEGLDLLCRHFGIRPVRRAA
jgi:hypothetical protein